MFEGYTNIPMLQHSTTIYNEGKYGCIHRLKRKMSRNKIGIYILKHLKSRCRRLISLSPNGTCYEKHFKSNVISLNLAYTHSVWNLWWPRYISIRTACYKINFIVLFSQPTDKKKKIVYTLQNSFHKPEIKNVCTNLL